MRAVEVALCGSRVELHPPQHVLLIEVRVDGAAFLKIIHASGHEDAGEFELTAMVGSSAGAPNTDDALNGSSSSARVRPSFIPEELLDAITAISSFDLGCLPSDYRVIPSLADRYTFVAGKEYSLLILSEVLAELNVIAS